MTHVRILLRAAVLALLLYSLLSLSREYRLLCKTQALAESLAVRQEALAAQKLALTQRLEQPPEEAELRRLAWERLGMLAPGEKVFLFAEATDETDREETLWDWKLEALWKDG